ncbi:hypothetical protein SNE40_011320 [Patella caerulea]|uniref:Uncharacterized protein n=1 Tax=Patella caerulea TaxID=87958 RepID=A0AAN8JRN4_PATCE
MVPQSYELSFFASIVLVVVIFIVVFLILSSCVKCLRWLFSVLWNYFRGKDSEEHHPENVEEVKRETHTKSEKKKK